MLFLIIVSFLQICFIPGFIAYTLLNRKSVDDKLLLLPVFSFGLSLIVNYVVVFSLVYFHLYTRFSLVMLVIFEIVILASMVFLKGKTQRIYNWEIVYYGIFDDFKSLFDFKKSLIPLLKFILFVLSIVLLIYLLKIWISNFGRIFEEWDAVFSWNKWATNFYYNKLPSSTYHYPQLIPANWSIAYVFCNYPFQFIPRIVMHLFLILMVYTFIVLGLTQKKVFFYFALLFIFKSFGGVKFHWTDGFVDVAVAFFSIMVFISLMAINEKDNEFLKFKYITLSVLFACGAAVTKQAGLFILVAYPFLLFILLKEKINWNTHKVMTISILYIALLVLIVLPYYLWAESEIKTGNAVSEISYVTKDIYHGATYSERFSHAFSLFKGIFSSEVLFKLSIILFLFSFIDKVFWGVNLSFIIYFIIWALFFSYDIRNIAIIIPYFSLSIGVGLCKFLDSLKMLMKYFNFKGIATNIITKDSNVNRIKYNLRSKTKIIVKGALTVLIIGISAVLIIKSKDVSMERLKESQDFRLKRIGVEEVNLKLDLYNRENPMTKKIITDYVYLMIQPEISHLFEYGRIENLEPTNKIFSDESNGFLLWTSMNADSTKFPNFIEDKVKTGTYTEIFNYKGFRFIKIR